MIGCVLLKTGAEIHCVAQSCLCRSHSKSWFDLSYKNWARRPRSSFSFPPPLCLRCSGYTHTHSAKFHFEMMVSNSARSDVAPAGGEEK